MRRNSEMRAKFLVDMRGVDVLMRLIQTPNSPLFRCAVLALSHQATCLQPTSPVCCEDSAAGGSTEYRPRVADAGAADDEVVVFVLDDGSRIDARRRVMSRGSDVFAAMLAGRFRESTERAVRIRAAATGAFRTMVACLHDDRPRRSAPGLDELCQLLALFHRFQIPDVVRRRTLLAPLIAAASEGAECGGKFARVLRLLSVYDDAGVLRGDFVVSLFTRQMSLRRRCAAVASVVSAEAECDVEEFVSIVTAALLNAIN